MIGYAKTQLDRLQRAARRPHLVAKRVGRTVHKAGDRIRAIGRCTRSSVAYYTSNPKPVLGYWWRGEQNVGDLMGPYILEQALGRQVVHIYDVPHLKRRKDVVVSVGSIIQQIDFARPQIWGAGLINPARVPQLEDPTFYSVRGPLTRQALIRMGYHCPEKYGDPGLLIGRYHDSEPSSSTGTYMPECGLVLHYEDEALLQELDAGTRNRVNIISVRQSVEAFVKEVKTCKFVLSSSLHGIITAHSVGIPAVWLRSIDNKKGGDFKYLDYLQSYGSDIRYVELRAPDSIEHAIRYCDRYSIYPPAEAFVNKIETYLATLWLGEARQNISVI